MFEGNAGETTFPNTQTGVPAGRRRVIGERNARKSHKMRTIDRDVWFVR